MLKFSSTVTMNPTPPAHLTKETIGVWNGWGNIGDKEVAREAAAKGSHIHLAITFLSARRRWVYEHAKTWFDTEVIKWVHELLERKQIFKASHVLNNIGVDATAEFSKIFYKTDITDVREYIGRHLLKIGKLEEHYQQLWSFLTLIVENESLISQFKLETTSLECLNNQDEDIKCEVATTLFLKTEDNRLKEFLNAETLWKQLLVNEDLNNLITWVNVKFKSHVNDIEGNMMDLFKKFSITNDMLNLIANAGLDTRNTLYNELSRFGIFQNDEKNDFLAILRRLKNSYSMAHLYQILDTSFSAVNVDHFIKLLVDYCLKQQRYSVLNACLADFRIPPISSDVLNLMNDFRQLTADFSEYNLGRNIFNVANSLSEDLLVYFSANPTVLLSLMFFTNNINILDILTTSELVTNDVNLSHCVTNMLQKFEILSAIYTNKKNGPPKCDLSVYDLIHIHLKFDPQRLFEFRYSDRDLSYFYNTQVVRYYGYSKTLNYKFYLKQSRPSAAAKFLILTNNGTIGDGEQKLVERQTVKLAITNFDCDKISASCVSFLEMIGSDSMKLRVLVKTARSLHQYGSDRESVLELLFNSEYDPYAVQNLLEKNLIEAIDTMNPFSSGPQTVNALKMYEIVVQYSEINSIKLPELFLKYLAGRNLWLPFLLVAQLHNYPVEQIKLLIHFFKSPNMLEHITHGVLNDILIEETNALMRDRDSRKYLLSKVGVRKSVDVLNPSGSLSRSSFESAGSSGSSDFFEIDVSNIKATLLQTLIRCHNSTDPPKALLQACQLYRNPLLAIFATSYEPDSIITNWLTWLAVSCELCKVFTNYETTALSATAVGNLLEKCVRKRYITTVLEGCEIFIPESPLKVFMEFVHDCRMLKLNESLLVAKLTTFQSALKNCRKNSIITETDHEMTYLNNKMWIEMTALRLLSALLDCNCNSFYEQLLIVESFCRVKIWEYFSSACPNFPNISAILKALYEGESGIRLDMSVMFDVKNSRQAIVSCINTLLEKQLYEVALTVARIENLPSDLILVKEWQSKIEDRCDQHFWHVCNESFVRNDVTADCVVDFFVECSEKFADLVEKFTLLKIAYEWAHKYDLSSQHELEKRMWVAFVLLDDKHRDMEVFDIKASTYLYKDLTDMLKNITPLEDELGKDVTGHLEPIVAFALNKGNFWLALKLQKIFDCKVTDLETLKLCHSLAEGILLPHQLNAEQRLLLSNVNYLKTYSHRRTLLSSRFSSLSSSSYSLPTSQHVQATDSATDWYANDTLAILKMLSEHLHNGTKIGQTIFMNYRISINIEIPYQVVVLTTDYMKILKDALADNCANKLDVVHDFIFAYKWSKEEIADFICEELINATCRYVESDTDCLIMWDLDLDKEFQLVLQLPQDCSTLGYKIYAYASTFQKSKIESQQAFTGKDLMLISELLIRAHDCFTSDCNMEGISSILKKSKEVVASLLLLEDWKLMVRLLTGVARYTEMNYVFEILREKQQFEYLLRRGLRKDDNSLKIALLEYLKKFCPNNHDLYTIVALHFALFSEVAMLWEKEAQNVIKNLISISVLEMQNNNLNVEEEPFTLLQNNESTKNSLVKAMKNFTHATDFHLQGEKLTKAMNSAKQAELIALQLGLLTETSVNGSVICLLNLKHKQISTLVSSRLGFDQALIVVDAYNFHADWASVLYDQYIVQNNVIFFEGFLQHLPLTDALVYDISRKFIVSSSNSVNETKCMKTILKRLNSPHMKYRIASELRFTDVVEDLIESGQVVYLKDTVWKKGYKS